MFEPDMLQGESDLVRNANVNMLRGKGMTELNAMRQAYGAQPALPGAAPMSAPPMPAPAAAPAPPMGAQPNAQALAHANPNASFLRGPEPMGQGQDLAQILARRHGQ